MYNYFISLELRRQSEDIVSYNIWSNNNISCTNCGMHWYHGLDQLMEKHWNRSATPYPTYALLKRTTYQWQEDARTAMFT